MSVLVVVFNDNNEEAPLRSELLRQLGLPKSNSKSYRTSNTEYTDELYRHKFRCERLGRWFGLHPLLSHYQGGLILGHLWQKGNVQLFESNVRLLSGGPTLPAFRLLRQVVSELKPDLVLYAGLSNGAQPAQQLGDVIVASQSDCELFGELESAPQNGKPVSSTWSPGDLSGLVLESLQETAMAAASPHYAAAPPAPASHTPTVHASNLAVLTQPGRSSTLPNPEANLAYAAVDCDAHSVALGADLSKWGLVVGVASPALNRYQDDIESIEQENWQKHFFGSFGQAVAQNVALVVARLVKNAPE